MRYQISPDVKHALLAFDESKVHRHSRVAKYAVLDIDTRFLSKPMK